MDQFENLDKHTQWGIDFLERYAKFVKERLEIEQTYAKQLRNLVKKYCPKRSKDDEPRFSSCMSFYSILNELNDYAGQREVVAEEMGHNVYGELMRYSQDLKSERKHHLQEGRKAQQYLDQCWKHMDNAKSQLYLRTHSADESKNEYAAQLQNFNGEQWKHFNVAIPQIFKNLQDMDERRTVKLGETYRSFAEVERRVVPIISKCLEGMVTAAKAVDQRKDSAIVVESFKSGFEPPGDFPFEDYSQNLSRTGSDNTISTPKNEGVVKPDPKHSISKAAKNKLWLFGKKPKAPSLEDFSHLPPEQRRKRLQARIDELSKELQKEVDQRDALNKMKDVYEKNPQMGDPQSLQPKISETMCNMEKLRSEIHKNESWLSEVEGKVSTRGDRRPSADVNHHTPHGRERSEGTETRCLCGNEFDDEFDNDDPLPVLGHCKALYSFDGQNEGTLLMKEDDVLYIIEEDKGDGWTRARKQSGEEGYVPTSYVEIAMEKNSKGAVTYI
uniref:Transducer of Cdc42-dependent actin assembly protein 1 n=1 Tax=Oncorhynchus tshawytscha TaxID=74940 RepID=A0AAZ3PCX5_ONCTS